MTLPKRATFRDKTLVRDLLERAKTGVNFERMKPAYWKAMFELTYKRDPRDAAEMKEFRTALLEREKEVSAAVTLIALELADRFGVQLKKDGPFYSIAKTDAEKPPLPRYQVLTYTRERGLSLDPVKEAKERGYIETQDTLEWESIYSDWDSNRHFE